MKTERRDFAWQRSNDSQAAKPVVWGASESTQVSGSGFILKHTSTDV